MTRIKLSANLFEHLRSNGVDTSKMLSVYGTAMDKREGEGAIKQSGKAFATSEKAKIERNRLTDAEDFVMSVFAMDSHIQKAEKMWGLFNQPLIPTVMLRTLQQLFPYIKKEETVEA